MSPPLEDRGAYQQTAGFDAFRHFNVALMDALRVPLESIQERIGQAVTGSFTLDLYGRTAEWKRNLEAHLLSEELERAVAEAEKRQQDESEAAVSDGLTPTNAKGSGAPISQAFLTLKLEWLRRQDLITRPNFTSGSVR